MSEQSTAAPQGAREQTERTDIPRVLTLSEAKAGRRMPDECSVRVYSGEHRAYWRLGSGGGGNGYTTNEADAGIWSFADAYRLTSHCGPEKRIEYHAAALLASPGGAERDEAAKLICAEVNKLTGGGHPNWLAFRPLADRVLSLRAGTPSLVTLEERRQHFAALQTPCDKWGCDGDHHRMTHNPETGELEAPWDEL